jgi:hypothetical protein
MSNDLVNTELLSQRQRLLTDTMRGVVNDVLDGNDVVRKDYAALKADHQALLIKYKKLLTEYNSVNQSNIYLLNEMVKSYKKRAEKIQQDKMMLTCVKCLFYNQDDKDSASSDGLQIHLNCVYCNETSLVTLKHETISQ